MTATPAPRLETLRLVLRGWEAADFDAHAAMSADPEVMRHLGGVLDRAASWRQMALQAGHWALRGYGNWIVERKADGMFVGRVGLWNPEGWPGLEIGWKLARHVWGQGYATEAAQAAMTWAWDALEISELISVIHPDNAPSIQVAERLGLRRWRDATVDGQLLTIYGIQRAADECRMTP